MKIRRTKVQSHNEYVKPGLKVFLIKKHYYIIIKNKLLKNKKKELKCYKKKKNKCSEA